MKGSKEHFISTFLSHFKTEWNLQPIFTLTDKDMSEINACRGQFPDAKHQLCFWHCLRAVKTRLSVLRRRPKIYNVKEAVSEFDFISSTFLPQAQSKEPLTQVCL